MIRIYSAANMVDAQLVCDALRQGGLHAVVSGAYLNGAAGELPVDSMTSVWLTEPLHESRARHIIGSLEAARRQPVVQSSCAVCGETVESNFSHCWNCHSFLPET